MEDCPKCGGPLQVRPAHPYPVVPHVIFGLSFVVFFVIQDRLSGRAPILWGWSAVQIALGLWLIRGRMRSRARVLRCIRCDAALR